MKKYTYIVLFLFFSVSLLYGQISYLGPAEGSLAIGAAVSTDDFGAGQNLKLGDKQPKFFNRFSMTYVLDQTDPTQPTINGEETFIFDPSYRKSNSTNEITNAGDSVFIFKKFLGFIQSNSIPPDPYLAVGPEHILSVVNSSFKISDKQGNTLFSLPADSWFSNVLSNAGTFDPKVVYDHFDKRWVMVWLSQDDGSSSSYFLISVSDDEDPMGTWFNWAVPSNVNGNTPSGGWGDYQGVGYDDRAIYITSNQFSFAGSYQYPKIRIIPKTDLYVDSNPGQVTWKDLWQIRFPGTGSTAFGIRPTIAQTASDNYYFATAGVFTNSNSFGVYTLSDPLGTPTLTGVPVSVASYSSPPNAGQLGTSNTIDGGGFNIRFEPIVKSGKLYLAHAVANGSSGSSVRFAEIDLNTMTAVRDFRMGTPNSFHNYPAIAVADNEDVVLTYSRSSTSEYMGAYYTVIPAGANSPVGSKEIKPGAGTYYVTYGGTRNRWGDYSGAWLDPFDNNTFWLHSEYVNATDQWGTYIAGVRAEPFENAFIFPSEESYSFSLTEVDFESEEQYLIVKNLGSQQLNISSIVSSSEAFVINTDLPMPVSLNTFDSVKVGIKFVPAVHGTLNETITINSSDSQNPQTVIDLNAKGFDVVSPLPNTLYASSSKGELIKIDESYQASILGASGLAKLDGIALDRTNGELITMLAGAGGTAFFRVNSENGEVLSTNSIETEFSRIAFDNKDVLYGISKDQKLYTINLESASADFIADIDIKTMGMTFHPTTNELWVSVDSTTNKDRLYKINTTDGSKTFVASVGNAKRIEAIAFDREGNLFGINYKPILKSILVSINTGDYSLTELGDVGAAGINYLLFTPESIVGVKENRNVVPTDYTLFQNYPNPFNPTTTIKYSLSEASSVKLTVFNVLGEVVAELVNDFQSAGTYNVNWNSKSLSGSQLSSGIYLYKIQAVGASGKEFVETRKMVFLK